ncbi:MAG: hypothetical protein ABIZ80_18225, partial [Bryobacteraceae bacterium]
MGLLLASGAFAAPPSPRPPGCVASVPVRSFRLTVAPPQGGNPRPLRAVQFLRKGQRLRYEPMAAGSETPKSAEVALIFLLPGDAEDPLRVLGPKPANAPAEWIVPEAASTVGLVYGPHGLDTRKVNSLLNKNHDLIPQLADYAGQTEQVEALVEGTGNLNAALSGFAARYNANTPKFDSKTPSEQQAAALFGALLPSLSAYDPVASQAAVTMRQSAGLAAAVASLFFGSPVGLAAGGAAMFQNLSSLAFPQTEFRSTFAQTLPAGAIGLCAKPRPAKSRTKTAFLWAHRVPGDAAPAVSLEPSQHILAAWKSNARITATDAAQPKLLERADGWVLTQAGGGAAQAFPITASVNTTSNILELDLSASKAPPGEYSLSAVWDWEPFAIAGSLQVDPFADLSTSVIVPSSGDQLIEGTGKVAVRLTGP